MANSIVKLTLESNQYEKGIKQAQKSWKQFTDGIGLSMNKLTAVGAAITAVSGALKVMKDAFNSSRSNIDEWGRTLKSAESVYNGFVSSLNNADFGGFLTRISDVVDAAKEAYNAMSDLQMFTAFNQRNVARSNANYQKALDEYKLNPTPENKSKLSEANKSVIDELTKAQIKTDESYRAALREIASQRLQTKELQDKFVETFAKGTYEDFIEAGGSFTQGSGIHANEQYYYGDRVFNKNVVGFSGRVKDRLTGKWSDMTDAENEQFLFARAIKQTTEEQVKEVQALGARAIAIEEQIARQDRQFNRMAGNNQKPSGGGGGGRKGGGGGIGAVIDYASDSIEAQEKLVNRLRDAWRKASAELRDGYKAQLDEAVNDLDYMTGRKKPIGKMETAQGVLNITTGNPLDNPNIALPTLTSPLQQMERELTNLMALQQQYGGFSSETYQAFQKQIDAQQAQINKFKGIESGGGSAKDAKFTDNISKMTGGISQIAGGLQQMGVEIPDNIQNILSVLQGVTTILTAILTIASVIEAQQSAQTTATIIDALSPLAGGGVAGAASGMVVGRTHSLDQIPAALNAGEVVLNRAQSAIIASQLEGGGLQNLYLDTEILGENMRIILNNNGKRTGKGRYVQTNKR